MSVEYTIFVSLCQFRVLSDNVVKLSWLKERSGKNFASFSLVTDSTFCALFPHLRYAVIFFLTLISERARVSVLRCIRKYLSVGYRLKYTT